MERNFITRNGVEAEDSPAMVNARKGGMETHARSPPLHAVGAHCMRPRARAARPYGSSLLTKFLSTFNESLFLSFHFFEGVFP
jgi:hypothetical protein